MTPLIVDQTDWGHILVSGPDRTRFLHGLCTADVAALSVGGWTRASILTPKARVVSVIEIIHQGDHLLIHCEPALADKTLALLQRHAIMDEVELAAVAQPVHRLWTDPAAVWTAPPVLAPPPGPAASAAEVEIRRIEAGYPRYGIDVSEDHFPFESKLRDHIDYQKGCYLGQEPVARTQNLGRANRMLLGLRVNGAEAVPVGAKVAHPERPDAGTVTSAVVSPGFGSIALGYLHRAVWEPGTRVTVADRPATVSDLPFA